jgi:hypothetical protein
LCKWHGAIVAVQRNSGATGVGASLRLHKLAALKLVPPSGADRFRRGAEKLRDKVHARNKVTAQKLFDLPVIVRRGRKRPAIALGNLCVGIYAFAKVLQLAMLFFKSRHVPAHV